MVFLTKALWLICPQVTEAQVLVTYLEDARLSGCQAPERKNAHPEKAGGKHSPFVPVLPGRVAQKASLQGTLFWSVGTALPRFCQKQTDERSYILEQVAARHHVLAAIYMNEGKEKEFYYNETKVHLGISFFIRVIIVKSELNFWWHSFFT